MGRVNGTHWETINAYRVRRENVKERKYVEDAATDGRMILKWISRNKMGGQGLVEFGSGQCNRVMPSLTR